MKTVLYKVASCPCQEGRLFEKPSIHQSEEAALLRDPCLVSTVLTYIVLMVWLKSPQSQLSKTFCVLKSVEY